jgi:hypothetical protein
MSIATSIVCPHCSAENAAIAQFCESCGKALPSLTTSGPRVVDGASFATTAAGQKLQSDELHKQAKKAAGALLTVAIIQTIICGVLVLVANSNNRLNVMTQNAAFLGIAGGAVIFWALFFWARRQPLPAAIVGLVLYATLVMINVVVSINTASQNADHMPHGGGFGGIGIGWLDIIILAVLGQAISAGSKYRKMMQTNVAA